MLFDAAGVTLVCICLSASCVTAAAVGGLVAARRRAQRGKTARSPGTRVTGALVSK
jgi:hypothetical protein